MKILITSGGTKIPIDKVRNITNMSTGTFGSKIAEEFLKLKHEVVFVKAKESKSPMTLNIDTMSGKYYPSPDEYKEWLTQRIKYAQQYSEYIYDTYTTYAELLKMVIGAEKPDIIVLAAAVSDYGVENYFDGKLRSNDELTIKLCQLPKIISHIKEWAPKAKLVGFKLMVNSKLNDLLAASSRSIADNGCDMVVANDLEDIKNDNHKVYLLRTIYNNESPTYKTYTAAMDRGDKNFLAKMVAVESLNL